MRKRLFALGLITIVTASMLAGCRNKNTNSATATDTTDTTEASMTITEKKMYADFAKGCPDSFEPSGDWSNGSMFNVTWRRTSCTYEDGKLQLTIDKDPKGDSIPYSGAELRSKDFYGYGRYEVSMKAIKNDGVVSSFRSEERRVGKGNHEKMVDLGFDASEDFHTYAFEWREDGIDWYVDGEKVHTATVNIPVTRSKIMMNAWCGTGVDQWLKAFDDSKLPITAEYQWISYTPFEQ